MSQCYSHVSALGPNPSHSPTAERFKLGVLNREKKKTKEVPGSVTCTPIFCSQANSQAATLQPSTPITGGTSTELLFSCVYLGETQQDQGHFIDDPEEHIEALERVTSLKQNAGVRFSSCEGKKLRTIFPACCYF